jgi:integrase/recombinase XerC
VVHRQAAGPCAGAYPRGLGADDRRLLPDLAASGQTAPTIRLRQLSLAHITRGLGRPPAEVTGEQLVAWFGRQTHWRPATRRNYRGAARGFFGWAYKADRVPDYLGDHLPSVRDSPPLPRPVPDTVWRHALAAKHLILLDTPG